MNLPRKGCGRQISDLIALRFLSDMVKPETVHLGKRQEGRSDKNLSSISAKAEVWGGRVVVRNEGEYKHGVWWQSGWPLHSSPY